MSGWSSMPSTTSRLPLTKLTTPSGRSSSSMIPKTICWVIGTCSEGLRTIVLPQAIAKGTNQNGTMAGKLKGAMMPQTPTGWRIVSASTPRATSSSTLPCMVVGIAVAASTISIIRPTSAVASGRVLPISVTTQRAISSLRASSFSRRTKSSLARAMVLTPRQAGSASFAARTASSRCAAVEKGTWEITSPLAGLTTSWSSAPSASTNFPPM